MLYVRLEARRSAKVTALFPIRGGAVVVLLLDSKVRSALLYCIISWTRTKKIGEETYCRSWRQNATRG